MNKKIITIALALVLPLTVAAFPGEGGGGPKGNHANKVERLAKKLDLTSEQKTKVEAIFKQQKEKFEAIRKDSRARMEDVLTIEQMEKLDQLKKQRKEKRQKRQKEGRNSL